MNMIITQKYLDDLSTYIVRNISPYKKWITAELCSFVKYEIERKIAYDYVINGKISNFKCSVTKIGQLLINIKIIYFYQFNEEIIETTVRRITRNEAFNKLSNTLLKQIEYDIANKNLSDTLLKLKQL